MVMPYQRFQLPERIDEGERNTTLYSYACSLWHRLDHVADKNELLEYLEKANDERCETPLTDSEILNIADSVEKHPQGPSPDFLPASRPSRPREAPPLPGADDVSIAAAFAAEYADKLRAVHDGERFAWYAYDGVKWTAAEGKPIAAQCLSDFIAGLCRKEQRAMDAEQDGDEEEGRPRRNRYRGYLSAARREALLRDAANRPELRARPEDFDRATNLLNLRNCTLDLDTLESHPHRPSDMCTRVAGCDYDKKAPQADWLEFLDGSFPGEGAEILPFLKVTMGLAVAGNTSQERFYILYGAPRAGKSTFLDVIGAAMGDYAHTSNPSTFAVSNRNAQGPAADYLAMEGARFLFCNEWPKDKRFDAAFVKSLTGNDQITARGVFGRTERNIRPHATLILNTNYLPRTNDPTLFTSGRAVVIPFTNSRAQDQQDRGLKNRLKQPANLSGVLNWLLDGWRFYAGTGRVPEVPRACEDAIARYALESDNVARFIADECEADQRASGFGNDLYTRYADYCDTARETPMSQQGFYRDLETKGYPVTREMQQGRQGKWVKGLRYRIGN